MKFILIERSKEKGTWYSLETDEFFYTVDERLLAEWDARGVKVMKYHVVYPINWIRRTLRFRDKIWIFGRGQCTKLCFL